MYTYDSMPPNARVWIYAADRVMTGAEVASLTEKAQGFLKGWTAHEVPVVASFDVLHNVFLVFMVDAERCDISGCGIDKSVAFVKETGKEMQIEFFNRMQIELMLNDGAMTLTNKAGAAELFAAGAIADHSLTFDKTLSRKEDFVRQFSLPVSHSWFYPSLNAHLAAE